MNNIKQEILDSIYELVELKTAGLSENLTNKIKDEINSEFKLIKMYKCFYTGKIVTEDEVIWVGSVLPNVKIKVPCAPGYEQFRKKSIRLFHESERNCNTCKHLQRVKHDKNYAGFLFGNCAKGCDETNNHPYKHLKQYYKHMAFHPDDAMHMECYESRYIEDQE